MPAKNETNLQDPSGPLSKVIPSSTILYTHDAHAQIIKSTTNLTIPAPHGHSRIEIQASA